ncbi:MAG: carbonic anhydrase [Bacteroidetes bacterium]|nr:MAG: carbonic anhydrase [Bacteroidota bacterium]
MQNTEAQTKESQSSMTPEAALTMLKVGNARYVENRMLQRDYLKQTQQTATGQYPFAAILGCIDSRVPAETVFDQGIGDIFNVRIAGNFINTDILGSLEFACKVAGSKLIVVLGHTSCGAVKGACDHVQLGNLTEMLGKIKPAVDAVTDETADRSSANASFVQKVIDMNVRMSLEAIMSNSPVLREMYENGEIDIVGAMYDVKTGKVDFWG